MNKIVKAFWQKFLEAKNLPQDTKCLEVFYFDITKESAAHLLSLVLSGKKKATASSLYHYQATGEAIPTVGSYSIVTDFDGVPHCVIKTTAIHIVPFKDLTYEVVKREGEDENLASWRSNHIHFFTEDGKASGYQFDWEMPVVFEDFEVVYRP